jgi:hypothetical protein
MAARGPAFGAVLFGGVFVIGVVITAKRWLAHRDELSGDPLGRKAGN